MAIDPAIAAMVAERQEKANQAYNDASYLRTTAFGMIAFLGLSLIPLVPLVYWGFLATFLLTVVSLVRWQISFGGLITNDPDFQKAKRFRTIGLLLILVAMPVGFVVRPLLHFFVSPML